MTIKFSELGENSSGSGNKEPLDEGWYLFEVSNVEFGFTPNKGTEQITVWCKVADGEHKGKTRLMNFYLTPKALWKLQLFLLSFGYEKAKQDIEVEDLIADLDAIKPTFKAYAVPNGKYNDFTNFASASEDAEDDSQSDLPFEHDDLPL